MSVGGASEDAGGRWSWRGFRRGLAFGLVLFAAWFAITGALAAGAALQFRSAASGLSRAINQGDPAAAAEQFRNAASSASSLDRRVNSAPWSALQSLPLVGPTARFAGGLASGAGDLLVAAEPVANGVAGAGSAGLAELARALAGVGDSLGPLGDTARRVDDELTLLDPAAVRLAGPLTEARDRLQRASVAAAEAAALGPVLPSLLGLGQPVRWLVVLSQPAEARGSGVGFYGAWLKLDVADGRFRLLESAANGPETAQVQDLSWLPEEYRRLWGTDAQYLWGFNLSRHYPYTAPVIHRALDPGADFVVSLDPRAVAGLIALSGPITVDGNRIDATNAEEFFAREIYVRYPDAVQKDAVTLAALEQVFAALELSDTTAPGKVLRALGPAIWGGHLQIWSPNQAIEAQLERSIVGGAVPDTESPWVTVAFNNSAGNKIDSYVKTSVSYSAVGGCNGGVVDGSLTATLSLDPVPPGLPPYIAGRNDLPGAPYATTSMLVHLYGPPGALSRSITIDGQEVPAVQGFERGHTVWGVKVQLAPSGPQVTVRAEFEQPAFPGKPLRVRAQPMVQDTLVAIDDRRACARG